MLQLAGAVPGFAQITTATHMGDGEDEAAVEQRQPRVGEPGVEAVAVGAVTIEVERCGLAEAVAAADQADGNLRTVLGGGPDAPTFIGVRIEGAFHRGFLEHLLRAVGQGQLADLRRAIQRLVAQADHRAGEFQRVLHVQAVGRIGQLQAIGLDALRSYLDHRQAAFAQGQGDRLGVQADILEHHRVIMRDQLLPVLAAWFGLAGVIKGEVDARLVAADQPAPLAFVQAMIGEVLVILLARRQAGPAALRLVRRQHPGFAGGLAVGKDDQLAVGAGAVAMHEEAPVRVVINLAAVRIAKAVAVNLVRAVGVVQLAVEQGLAVVGPGHAAVAVVEGQLGDLAAGQVLDVQPVDLVALAVEAVGELAVVLADAEGTQRKKAAAGQLVGVEQQLFGAFIDGQRTIQRARAAVVPRILVACGGALVVQPRPPGGGQ